jgi:hypothetical protein
MRSIKFAFTVCLLLSLVGCSRRAIEMKDISGCYAYDNAKIRINATDAVYNNQESSVYLMKETGGPSLLYISPGIILSVERGETKFELSGKKASYHLITSGPFSESVAFFTDTGKSIALKREDC